ncbi:hypothetical protein GCM10007895_33640 [Paraferrimonas sedimenticola]|uniref:Uncharacterized protein n=1 Tax=Paraferrimonas sedimenticola TaxID=375674 RepID=A0AA37S0E0_9GAMM|nr:hypothetical protein GCM10007895_33640 [Paraferrimonas sedimenticola]
MSKESLVTSLAAIVRYLNYQDADIEFRFISYHGCSNLLNFRGHIH